MSGDGAFFELHSREGTTQGCPLAMAMYALALVPLLKEVQSCCKQAWYADDATGCDTITRLHQLCLRGPRYGHYIKPESCILVVKPRNAAEAHRVFGATGVEISADGAKDVGTES